MLSCGEALGIIFSSIVHVAGISVTGANLLTSQFTLMAGIYSLNMPVVLDYINRISPMRYVLRVFMAYEFATLKVGCDEKELLHGPGGNPICPVTSGQQTLELYQFASSPESIHQNLMFAAGLTVTYRILGYFVLRRSADKVKFSA